MRSEGMPIASEFILTGEYPAEKTARCGEFVPFTTENAAQFWACSVYDYLHGSSSENRIAMPLVISPHLEIMAQQTLERMIRESCEGNA